MCNPSSSAIAEVFPYPDEYCILAGSYLLRNDSLSRSVVPIAAIATLLLSYEERERRMKQATERAGIVRDLLWATILGD